MSVFAFQNAYPETGDCSVIESDDEQADFDIDSDASDVNLLELKQELIKLGSEKAQRDLADVTIAAQEMTRQRWKRYVSNHWLSQLRLCISIAEADFICFFFTLDTATLCARIT